MTQKKIAITLAPHLVQQAKRAVKAGEAGSVSAYVATAMTQQAKLYDLETLLEEMLQESGGPLTKAEKAAMDQELNIQPKRRRGRAA